MTISTETARDDYVGNGLLDTYSYTFKIFSSADLLVTVRDTDDVETTLALTTDYTVAGVGDANGSITLVAGVLTTDYLLTIRRNRALTQDTDIRNQGEFFPEIHEDAFDDLVMKIQTLKTVLNRTIQIPETVTGVSTDLPIPAASKVFRWDSAGTAIENVDVGSLGSIVTVSGGLQLASDDLSIADLGVVTAKLNALAVTAAKLAADAVETAKIKDGAVTAAKLAAGAAATNFTELDDTAASLGTAGSVPRTNTGATALIQDGGEGVGVISGLKVDNHPDAPTTKLSASGTYTFSQVAFGMTMDATTTGAGGIAAADSALANSTEYYLHLMTDEAGTQALMLATSKTPTLPGSYKKTNIISALKTNGSAQLLHIHQRGNRVNFDSPESVATGLTSITYTNQDVSSVVPTDIAQWASFAFSGTNAYFWRVGYDGTYPLFGGTMGTTLATGGVSHMVPLNGVNVKYLVQSGATATMYVNSYKLNL